MANFLVKPFRNLDITLFCFSASKINAFNRESVLIKSLNVLCFGGQSGEESWLDSLHSSEATSITLFKISTGIKNNNNYVVWKSNSENLDHIFGGLLFDSYYLCTVGFFLCSTCGRQKQITTFLFAL